MTCEGLITQDITFDCANSPVAGLEVNVLLFNQSDVDYTAITYDAGSKDKVTNFQLKSGKIGYLLQGIKQINLVTAELVKKEFSNDKFKHVFQGVILNVTSAHKDEINNMAEGGRYVAIIERKWKGANNAEAFQIAGLVSGLELNTITYNTNENDGVLQFTLESIDGFEEPTMINTLLETDYATTKTAFDAKFVQA